jgi:hypothetical protein
MASMKRLLMAAALLSAAAIAVEPAIAATIGAGGTARQASQVANTLHFTLPDGSEVKFPTKFRVWCGKWASDVPTRAIHLEMAGLKKSDDFWSLEAVISDVKDDPTVPLPKTFVFDHPEDAELFADVDGNEVSSAQEEARGKIVFKRVRCGENPRIRFSIDAKLGSEFSDGQRLKVVGGFLAASK